MSLKRALSWSAVAVCILAPVLLPSVLAPAPVLPDTPNAEAAEPPVSGDERIDIVHDVVRIDVTRPVMQARRPGRTSREPEALRVYMRAYRAAAETQAAPSNPLVRAVRAVAGDGKYRPAPFPSPRP
jgi:hypothetical protein